MDRPSPATAPLPVSETVLSVLAALSISHLLNDTIQSLLPAIYPVLKTSYHLSFADIGLITLVFQATASLLQPVVGTLTDRRPQPYSLAGGMAVTLVGLVLLSRAHSFHAILVASALVGMGSSIFHPEASRLARLASGGKHGLAQSLFQVGGNFGTSLGPLLAAAVVVPDGQRAILWFTILAAIAIALLARLGAWYHAHLQERRRRPAATHPGPATHLSRREVVRALVILGFLIFSKYFYLTSLTNYYTFFLISKFKVSVQHSQILLFVFLFSVAAGTIIGGPVGDRIGRKLVIWVSILGVAPFTLVLPYVGLTATAVLTVFIGLILASAFSAILVYGQELVPGKVGTIAGMFFGFAFGVAGIGSALLGELADHTGIVFVYRLCGFLPLMGLLAAFLPNLEPASARRR